MDISGIIPIITCIYVLYGLMESYKLKLVGGIFYVYACLHGQLYVSVIAYKRTHIFT